MCRKRTVVAVLAVGIAGVGGGCATIVASGPDNIPINSQPEGARVSLDGMPVGKTPMILAVKRTSDCVITVEAPGYEKATIDRDKSLNGWFLGNAIFGGLIGVAIDLIGSHQGLYSTDPINVELTPREGRSKGPS